MSGAAADTPFWWLGDARLLLAYHVDHLGPVLDRFYQLHITDDMPLDTCVDADTFAWVFKAYPAIDAATVARLFQRLQSSQGVVDLVQVRTCLCVGVGG
jgi:hypothetical protein